MQERKIIFWVLAGVVFFILGCQGFDAQIQYNQAQRAHDEGNFKVAIKLYKKLLADDPKDEIYPPNPTIRYDLAVAYIDTGLRAKAAAQMKILNKKGDEDLAGQIKDLLLKSEMLVRYDAEELHKAHDVDGAIKGYLKSLKMNPDNETVNYNLGIAYVEKGNSRGAKKQIKKLEELGRGDLAKILSKLLTSR